MKIFNTQIPVNRRTPTKVKGDKAVCLPDFVFMEHYKNYSLENIIEEINGIVYVEQWKPINGYELLYSISNFGRVKALAAIKTHGKNICKCKEKILKQGIVRGGYCCVKISNGFDSKNFSVHRLVAKYYIPNPNNLPEVNHLFGLKCDNRETQLEWVTKAQNMKHSVENGFHPKGEKNGRSKLSENQVKEILSLKLSHGVIAKIYGVSKPTIQSIKIKRNWKHI